MTTALAAKVDTWNQLTAYVESNDGVACITMYELRKIAHAGRLGSTVRAMIKEKLNSLGLDMIRDELPNTQDAQVVLFKTDSRAGRMIRAVSLARKGEDLEDCAKIIRTLNDTRDTGSLKVDIMDGIHELEEKLHRAEDILSA